MPSFTRECPLCGNLHYNRFRAVCNPCKRRPRICRWCGRSHFSQTLDCSACRKAARGLTDDFGPTARAAMARMQARAARLELQARRNALVPEADRRSQEARAGHRFCGLCGKAHRDARHVDCRQCRLVDHAACASCGQPYRETPTFKTCNTCRVRARRERKRAARLTP